MQSRSVAKQQHAVADLVRPQRVWVGAARGWVLIPAGGPPGSAMRSWGGVMSEGEVVMMWFSIPSLDEREMALFSPVRPPLKKSQASCEFCPHIATR